MRLIGDDWVVAMATVERDALLEALDDVVNRYESADEHVDNPHYEILRLLLATLEQDD